MKTVDEIKKGLECCSGEEQCDTCPYLPHSRGYCYRELKRDALTIITLLSMEKEVHLDVIRMLQDELTRLTGHNMQY